MNSRRPHRKGGKPPFQPRPGGDKPRGAPPDQTGAETHYLIKNMEARTPMVVRLVGNEEVRGWIEYYDRDVIKVNRPQPPHLLIRKETIKYIYKDEVTVRLPPREEG